MLVEITERDRYILNCIVEVWDEEGEGGHYGDISYGEVFDLLDKLGLDRPKRLTEFIETYNKPKDMESGG